MYLPRRCSAFSQEQSFSKSSRDMSDLMTKVVTGDVGSMDADHRLIIPASVRDALEWFPQKKKAKPFPLIADLRDSGLIRLYPAERARPQLDATRQRLLTGHSEPLQALAAFADRYRELTYYSSDSRLHCGAAIGWHLRSASEHPVEFYVEALGDFIDVMTLERRTARLRDLRADLDLVDD
jgi:hypothetical protein